MVPLRRRSACWLVGLVLLGLPWAIGASERSFPYAHEMMLDAAPMPGSKRIPILQFDEDGTATLDLWCMSVQAQATIGDGSISIVPGELQPAQCAPERQSGDENLLAALAQVTNWRRRGDIIEFSGSTTLRFRLMTN